MSSYNRLYNEIMEQLPELIQQAMNESAIDDVVIEDAQKEKEFLTSDINGEHNVINLMINPDTSIIYNEEASQKQRLAFSKWLR